MTKLSYITKTIVNIVPSFKHKKNWHSMYAAKKNAIQNFLM